MRRNLAITGGLAVALVAGGILGPVGIADAGHTNRVLTADLDGRREVDPSAANRRMVGDPDGRGEVYVFGVDGDPTTLCYVLTVDRLDGATGAHIHEGGKGENGPVVANLAAPGDGNAGDCLTEGEPGKFPTGESVQEILEHPERYYVNVHTAEHLNGAIRGQLAPQG